MTSQLPRFQAVAINVSEVGPAPEIHDENEGRVHHEVYNEQPPD